MVVIRSLFPRFQALFFCTCRCPGLLVTVPQRSQPLSNRRVVAGTFFGHKRGRVSFALQTDTLSEPFFLLELAIPTYQLVKEMASGMVRILLECRKLQPPSAAAYPTRNMNAIAGCSLHKEPVWIMCCNGRQQGYAVTRHANASDLRVLSKLQAISAGAGVISSSLILGSCPPSTHSVDARARRKKDGLVTSSANSASDVMYMRAHFERVVGGKDSEAFYMMNPDTPGGKTNDLNNPGLSIFLLRK